MATPKLNKLAQRFMQQIQDPITIDAGVILPGQVIRQVAEIEHYLGMAAMKYIEAAWLQVQGNGELLLRAMPDLYAERYVELSIATSIGNNKVDISATHADVWDILNSRASTTKFEVWHPKYLTEAIQGANPFYVGDEKYGGIIFQKPYLWVFPLSIMATERDPEYFTLCFIKAPLNPVTGEYLVSGGAYDIPFGELHFTEIANIAEKLYKVDDYQEDAR